MPRHPQRPLSIGVDARPLAHPFTGIGRYTHAILSRITASGHRFHLYATQPFDAEYTGASSRVHAVDEQRLRSTLAAQRYFPRWSREDRLDLFWSPRHHLPLRLSCPSVVTVHDLVWRAVPHTMAPFARHVERLLMTPSVRLAHRIIAVSQSTAHDLERWQPALKRKIHVIPEAPCEEPGGDADLPGFLPERYFLFVGTFEPRKNLNRLIEAFGRIAQDVPHHLVLAGGRGWGAGIGAALAELDDESAGRIHCIHPEQGVSLAALYAGCEAFVYPSLYEGFGLPLAEAMAFGKPLLTANNSSLPEVAGEAAIYVEAESVSSIAEGMRRLALEPALRQRLSDAARRRAADFSWDRAAAATLSVLEDVASS